MNTKVEDLMYRTPITTRPHKSVGHVKGIMIKNGIHSVPVVDEEDMLKGIVTTADMIEGTSDETPVGRVMTKDVYTVPLYSDVHVAARVMRNHKIHHVAVTHEQKLVGVLSSFDLLKLVEEHRFVMKAPPTPASTKPKRQ